MSEDTLGRTALFRIVCLEAYADGKIEDEEGRILQRLQQLLRIPPETAQGLLAEAKEEAKPSASPEAGALSPRDTFRRAAELAWSDGELEQEELQLLVGLASVLGLDEPTARSILDQVCRPEESGAGEGAPSDSPVDAEHVALGEAADAHSGAGRYQEAMEGYGRIFEEMLAAKAIDSFLLAKLTLGRILTLLRAGETLAAHRIWVADSQTYEGMGVQFIEQGMVSTHDAILYMMMSGFFHSLSTGDKAAAAEAVNRSMAAVCNYAREQEPELLPQGLSNWHRHLGEVYEDPPEQGVPPPAAAATLQEAVQAYGEPLRVRPIRFPQPSPWEITW